MGGLCLALISQRRDVVAAVAGAGIAVVGSLALEPSIGIVAGGALGPLIGCSCPPHRHPSRQERPDDDRPGGPALLMAAVTYPSRALPLLVPGVDRLPLAVLAYLELVGPATLAALAAVNTIVVADAVGRPALQLALPAVGVVLCVVVVAWRKTWCSGSPRQWSSWRWGGPPASADRPRTRAGVGGA